MRQKYEARTSEVEIDIYIPFYSNPGLPAELLGSFVNNIEGFKTLRKEVLVILKENVLRERAQSVKGRKDLIDIISLFSLPDFDWHVYKKVVTKYNLTEVSEFSREIIEKTTQISELELNVYKMAKLKKKNFAAFLILISSIVLIMLAPSQARGSGPQSMITSR